MTRVLGTHLSQVRGLGSALMLTSQQPLWDDSPRLARVLRPLKQQKRRPRLKNKAAMTMTVHHDDTRELGMGNNNNNKTESMLQHPISSHLRPEKEPIAHALRALSKPSQLVAATSI